MDCAFINNEAPLPRQHSDQDKSSNDIEVSPVAATRDDAASRAPSQPRVENGFGFRRPPRPVRAERLDPPKSESSDPYAEQSLYLHQRLLERGADALAPKEILQLLLSVTCHPATAELLASNLLDHFGSLGGVLAAPLVKLKQICGLDERSVIQIKAARATVITVVREPLEERPIINSASSLMDYLLVSLRHDTTEVVRVIFLDKNNGLIKDEMQHRGTVDQTQIYPREIIKRVIDLDASAIILVHNHPSGDPTPSLQDIEMTNDIGIALQSLGVVFHDHVIVSRNKVISLRGLGLLRSAHSIRQAAVAREHAPTASCVPVSQAVQDAR